MNSYSPGYVDGCVFDHRDSTQALKISYRFLLDAAKLHIDIARKYEDILRHVGIFGN